MTTQRRQRALVLAAALLGAAPLGFGLCRRWQTGSDSLLSMALAATIFTAGVLAANIGRRRSRKAAYSQATVILVVSTLLAGGTEYMLSGSSGSDVWTVAFLVGAVLSASSFCLWLSRSTE